LTPQKKPAKINKIAEKWKTYMYTNASEIGWDNPTEPRRQKRDLPTERLGQNHSAVKVEPITS